MAKGKPEENNPKRKPKRPRPPGMFVPLDSPIRKEEKEMRRQAGLPQAMHSEEQLKHADEALRERPPSTRALHDERYNEDKSSY